jgi:ligand-binding sensor domain-containing protein|tara:strand:- start:1013 stop:2086 length:1074 start_codon:yes stop_codon:yes gene_type:complete
MKRKLIWFYLLQVVVILNYSCKNSDYKTANSVSETKKAETKIDTTQWLKETRGIRDILEDNKGNLWFSSPDYVAKFDGKAMYYFSENDGLNIVGNLHTDINGTIWIEDGFKIFRYNGKRFIAEKFNDNLVSNRNQNGLWFQRGLSPTDTLYVEPGIYNLNNKNTEFFPFPLKKDDNNKYLYYPTTKAYMGKDSVIWVGTMEQVFGLNNSSFITIGSEEMGRQNDERQMGIRGIFVDSKGKLWIADNGAGVFVYDGSETLNFTAKHNLDEGDIDGSTLHRAFSIAEDSEGNMWFGTVYSGIWKYNPKTDEFKNYTKDDGVKSDNIWTIYKTKKDELLFAGESPAAVYKFNGIRFDRIY